jgi:hypothetical protein
MAAFGEPGHSGSCNQRRHADLNPAEHLSNYFTFSGSEALNPTTNPFDWQDKTTGNRFFRRHPRRRHNWPVNSCSLRYARSIS